MQRSTVVTLASANYVCARVWPPEFEITFFLWERCHSSTFMLLLTMYERLLVLRGNVGVWRQPLYMISAVGQLSEAWGSMGTTHTPANSGWPLVWVLENLPIFRGCGGVACLGVGAWQAFYGSHPVAAYPTTLSSPLYLLNEGPPAGELITWLTLIT